MSHGRIRGVMQFGTLADWVAALASIGALAIAALAWITARRFGSGEEERTRRGQAERISAWFASEVRDGTALAYGIMLKNASATLVYDIEVVAKSKINGTYPPLRLTCLPPGSHWAAWSARDNSWGFPVDPATVWNDLQPVASSDKLGIQMLSFRDASDHVWTRVDQGALASRPEGEA
jgi:hypothetical protein